MKRKFITTIAALLFIITGCTNVVEPTSTTNNGEDVSRPVADTQVYEMLINNNSRWEWCTEEDIVRNHYNSTEYSGTVSRIGDNTVRIYSVIRDQNISTFANFIIEVKPKDVKCVYLYDGFGYGSVESYIVYR